MDKKQLYQFIMDNVGVDYRITDMLELATHDYELFQIYADAGCTERYVIEFQQIFKVVEQTDTFEHAFDLFIAYILK